MTTFPVYKIYKPYGLVVMFTSKNEGEVIRCDNGMYKAGAKSIWRSYDASIWKDYIHIKEYSPDQNGDLDSDI